MSVLETTSSGNIAVHRQVWKTVWDLEALLIHSSASLKVQKGRDADELLLRFFSWHELILQFLQHPGTMSVDSEILPPPIFHFPAFLKKQYHSPMPNQPRSTFSIASTSHSLLTIRAASISISQSPLSTKRSRLPLTQGTHEQFNPNLCTCIVKLQHELEAALVQIITSGVYWLHPRHAKDFASIVLAGNTQQIGVRCLTILALKPRAAMLFTAHAMYSTF